MRHRLLKGKSEGLVYRTPQRHYSSESEESLGEELESRSERDRALCGFGGEIDKIQVERDRGERARQDSRKEV